VTWLLQLIHEFRPYIELLNATSAALSIITWLVAIPLLIVAGRKSKLVRVRAFGIEATFRQGVEAAAAIAVAAERRSMAFRPSELARTVEAAIAPARNQRLVGKSVLWVDDNPAWHEYESRALAALEIRVTNAFDTEPALQQVSREKYDLIISDMARPSGKYAGYALLQALREGGNAIPFIVYSGSNAPEHKQEALRRGAQGATNDPQELLELVDKILVDARN
jgi:CheY-like chemotaxis protein